REQQARTLRESDVPTLPSSMEEERAANPFLRVDALGADAPMLDAAPDRVARFAALRAAKDSFRA
ncbi:MAG: hydroxyacylglutathione hydrolase C-terminal domain-containing protein, partial [Rhodanobacteraceae bacterium]